MSQRDRRRFWAVASHSKGARLGRQAPPLFWAEPGVWVGFARDARRFRSAADAERAARELGGDAVVVEMEG